MIKEISDIDLEDERNKYMHKYRHDRLDVYIATESCSYPDKMAVKVKYEILSIECNPDLDW